MTRKFTRVGWTVLNSISTNLQRKYLLADPFFKSSKSFADTLPYILSASFLTFISARYAFSGFMFFAFSANSLSVVVVVMISQSLIESSVFSFKRTHLYEFFHASRFSLYQATVVHCALRDFRNVPFIVVKELLLRQKRQNHRIQWYS